MSQALDPIVLARFMVMDGASRLVTAFSGIPEGPLRESVIHMAETMSATYASAPANARAPDPLNSLGGGAVVTPPAPPPRRAIPGPVAKTADPMVRAAQLRLEGKFPHEIVAETGLSISHVYKAIGEARKAGMKFPDIGRASPGVTPVKASYITDVSQITSPVQMGALRKAAEARGITVEGYLARRKLALEMGLDGRHVRAIMEATKEPKTTLSNWFNTARACGHVVPYMVDQQFVRVVDGPPGTTPKVVHLKPPTPPPIKRKWKNKRGGPHKNFVIRLDDYQKAGQAMQRAVEKGANLKGVSVDEYLRLRREAITLFDTGRTALEVAETLGLTHTQASNWRERAQTAGLLSNRYNVRQA